MSHPTTCGSCHQSVGPNDVTCPHCGAWLAAYASAMDAPVTPVIAPVAPPAAVPSIASSPSPVPTATPRRGLMDDLLKQSHIEEETDPAAGTAKGESTFAQEVEAELRDAKVVIDERVGAVIRTAPDADDVVMKPAMTSGNTATPAAERSARARPVPGATGPRPVTMSTPASVPEPPQSNPGAGTLPPPPVKQSSQRTHPVLIVVFVIFILSAFRNAGAAGFLILALVIGALFFWFALGMSKSSGRRTGDMPLDELFRKNRRNRRR